MWWYINDIPQALSNSYKYLFAEDKVFFYQHEDVTEIQNVLHKEFTNVCDWFVDNKLWVYLVKTKLSAFISLGKKTYQSLT